MSQHQIPCPSCGATMAVDVNVASNTIEVVPSCMCVGNGRTTADDIVRAVRLDIQPDLRDVMRPFVFTAGEEGE